MKDFANWCIQQNLVNVFEDGTVAWKESTDGPTQKGNYEQKFGGARDGRKDLSDDHKDYCHHMGTVWPFKLVAKGKGGKAVAPVGK